MHIIFQVADHQQVLHRRWLPLRKRPEATDVAALLKNYEERPSLPGFDAQAAGRRPCHHLLPPVRPGQNSLFSLLTGEQSIQSVLINCLVFVDETLLAAGMHDPG